MTVPNCGSAATTELALDVVAAGQMPYQARTKVTYCPVANPRTASASILTFTGSRDSFAAPLICDASPLSDDARAEPEDCSAAASAARTSVTQPEETARCRSSSFIESKAAEAMTTLKWDSEPFGTLCMKLSLITSR